MLPMTLYYGIVDNLDDPDRSGKIRIRILPEMESADRNHLPWLSPFSAGNGSLRGAFDKHHFEEGTPVWCFFTDISFRTGWFISGVFLNETFDYTQVSNELQNISEESIGAYNQISFSRFPDGTVEFRNNSTGMMGVYHATGSYIIFSSNGDVIVYSKTKLKVYNDNNSIELKDSPLGGIQFDSSGKFQFNGSSDNLVTYSALQSILNQLVMNLDTRVYIDPLSGMTGMVNPTHIHLTFDPQFTTNLQTMKADDLETN